jgi:hypothetical protein
VLKALGGDALSATTDTSEQYIVNVAAIRRHGTTA